MFSYAHYQRDRYTLRQNEPGLKFSYWHAGSESWRELSDIILASHSAVYRGELGGTKLNVSSVFNMEQVLLIVNLSAKRVIGSVIVDINGAIKISQLPDWEFSGRKSDWPDRWQNRLGLALGIPGPCTINVRDVTADDEDILRIKKNEGHWFVPARYMEKTKLYDKEDNELSVLTKKPTIVKGEGLLLRIEPKPQPGTSNANQPSATPGALEWELERLSDRRRRRSSSEVSLNDEEMLPNWGENEPANESPEQQ